MARSRAKSKARSESPGGFGALPRIVWNHPDYQDLSGSAVKLLMDFACQYNGRNNGDLTAAYTILKRRGWKSQDTIKAAVKQLVQANLIIRTRTGQFCNPGGRCHLYAITWRPIDECPGRCLDVKPTTIPPRRFSVELAYPPTPRTGDSTHQKLVPKRARDKRGRFLPNQNLVRLVETANTKNW